MPRKVGPGPDDKAPRDPLASLQSDVRQHPLHAAHAPRRRSSRRCCSARARRRFRLRLFRRKKSEEQAPPEAAAPVAVSEPVIAEPAVEAGETRAIAQPEPRDG